MDDLVNQLPLSKDLKEAIKESSNVVDVACGTEVMYEGQYIKFIPIVAKGLVKVFIKNEDKELLLYYIQPNESCIMTFNASLDNSPSKVYASAEEDSRIMLLPVDKVFKWLKEYPELNVLFFRHYNSRYSELVEMIGHILFNSMDIRLLNYLKSKIKVKAQNPVKLSHRQIANELGTAREVVSRILKKLEYDNKIIQDSGAIKVL